MCVFCAAIPVAGAVGAKLNADQIRKAKSQPANGQEKTHLPIATMTGGVILVLAAGSVIYHTSMFGKS